MAGFRAIILRVTNNGPYSYTIVKDGTGLTSSDNIANVNSALDGVKTDIAAALGGETVQRIDMTVKSA